MDNLPSQPLESITHVKKNPPDDKSGEETNQILTLTTSADKPMKIPQPKDGSSKQGSGEVQSVHETPCNASKKDSLSAQSTRRTNNVAPVEKAIPSINGDKLSVAPHPKESDQVQSEENSITTSQRQQLTKKQKKKLRQIASGTLSERDEDQEADSEWSHHSSSGAMKSGYPDLKALTRITETQNKVAIKDRMFGRLLSLTNQPNISTTIS
ncbi:hypothetical protein QJS10_CPB20g00918 [Acorus calamus]|uniref:Uncharacterized protein n=1 Tax=Acorus calamus TaxID=4465 RepID=A0AAV9C9B8_ACOCL|nr:hypothetical protein QJS10_CPB20g00918 [Acorus calamus]